MSDSAYSTPGRIKWREFVRDTGIPLFLIVYALVSMWQNYERGQERAVLRAKIRAAQAEIARVELEIAKQEAAQ